MFQEVTFQARKKTTSPPQKKKINTRKISLYLSPYIISPSSSNIKTFLVCSQKKGFLLFQEKGTPKKFLIFQETELFYILGNRNPKKLLIFQKVTFRALKMKKTHSEKTSYISRIRTSSPKKPYKTHLRETGCLSNHLTLMFAKA